MAGKAKPWRLTDKQRDFVAANIGLAYHAARRLCRSAPWLHEHDAYSICHEALCIAVAQHERKSRGAKLGTFVAWWVRSLLQHDRSYRNSACRSADVIPLDDDLMGSDAVADPYAPLGEEVVAACESILAVLDETQAQAAWLCCALGLTPTQAAAWMGLTEARVRTLVRQGVRKARRELGVAT